MIGVAQKQKNHEEKKYQPLSERLMPFTIIYRNYSNAYIHGRNAIQDKASAKLGMGGSFCALA
jgi:hypothetical protein